MYLNDYLILCFMNELIDCMSVRRHTQLQSDKSAVI